MRTRTVDILLLAGLAASANYLRAAQEPQLTTQPGVEQLSVGAGKTRLLDEPVNIERVAIANPLTAEAVPVSPRTIMINGRAAGQTSLVIWLSDGSRREYDLTVRIGMARVEVAQEQLTREFGSNVQLTVDNASVYLNGTVKDMFEADRALSIVKPLGVVINLLKVQAPPQEQQILVKVRFADVDRSKSLQAGMNFFGAPYGWPFNVGTGSTPPNTVSSFTTGAGASSTSFSLADSLNILLIDPHAAVGTTLQALASQNILQILAEPNLLTMNGKEASFLAGGEFPFPTLQGGAAGVGQVTISFKEFGIRLRFIPNITPRGTIRLHVAPEVSSLDYANALVVNGSTVPAIDTRKVDTEVELLSGQSFAIAGLLNNQVTDTLSKIPGLGDIPLLGKLFQSRQTTKNHSELLVIVTPELVSPIPAGQPLPDLERPKKFLEGPGVLTEAPRTPGADKTGAPPPTSQRAEITVQEMDKIQKTVPQTLGTDTTPAPSIPLILSPGAVTPVPANPAPPQGSASAQGSSAPAASNGGTN